MRTLRSQITALLVTVTAVAAALGAAGEPPRTRAAHGPRVLPAAPATQSSIDARSPGLALHGGAGLAPPRVLGLSPRTAGLSRVVGDQEESERREDTGAQVTFTLQAKVLFAKDSARLSGPAISRITAVAREMRPQPGTKVRVYGFTDNLGPATHGDTLSRQRARAVQQVLARELRGTAAAFETRGLGERHPVAPNTTQAGRAKNRRVEISFSPTEG